MPSGSKRGRRTYCWFVQFDVRELPDLSLLDSVGIVRDCGEANSKAPYAWVEVRTPLHTTTSVLGALGKAGLRARKACQVAPGNGRALSRQLELWN